MENDEQQELSWQSAFWAVVAIALCAATEPSGSILGMPREWGFALKCSPVMCLFNALEALLCIRIERHGSRWRLMVRFAKYTDASLPRRQETTADQHATGRLDANAAVRLVSFILGPLLQAVKLFACSGILYTKLLAGCYLLSFLCDELALNFIWLSSTEGHRDATPSSLVASVLSMLGQQPRSQEGEQPAAITPDQPPTSELPDLLPLPAQVAADISITAISWFMCSLVFILLFVEPNLADWIRAICMVFLVPIGGIGVAVKRFWRNGFTLRAAKDLGFKYWMFVTAWALFGANIEKGPGIVSMESSSRRLYAAGTPFLAGYAHGVGTLIIAVGIGMAGLRYIDAWGAANLSPAPAEMVSQRLYPTFLFAVPYGMVRDATGLEIWNPAGPKPSRVWGTFFPGFWCLLHFLTALLFYYSMFDSSKTVKPGWTELLG
ncbi:hypothetical protein PG993_013454 [Apiospora rasikravindrae]|uniref:Uncharacterized protein n=1 Tax=Apiospora rasikravindrae TaxID=990691 RepID=A0ABR1RYX4_9PEZI